MKKRYKRLTQLIGLLVVVLFLAGCVKRGADGQPYGAVYEYIGVPTSKLMDWFAQLFGGSYGIAIIIITLLIRLIMLPSSLKMQKDNMYMQAKMKFAQEELDQIQAELQVAQERGDQALVNELSNEQMQVYKKYDINTFSSCTSGCLPLLIQLPIISAVYAAIESSEAIMNSTFLGLNLGESKNWPITIAVAVVYLIQSWLMKKSAEPANQNTGGDDETANQMNTQMNAMYLMNPIMLGWLSYQYNAGLGIYFLAGGVFAIIQQLYTDYIMKPRTQAKIDQEMKKYEDLPKRKPKTRANNSTKSDGTSRLVPTKRNVQQDKKNRRNEGKQQRRK